MPRATSEPLALSLRLCASQLGPARGQRPKPAALPSAAAWSPSPLQSARLAGASAGTLGKEWDMTGVLAPKCHPEGFPSQVLPLSWQITTALPSQGTDDSLATCPLRSPGAAETTGTGEGFQKHLCEIAATGKATTSVEGAGGGRRLQAARLRGHMG